VPKVEDSGTTQVPVLNSLYQQQLGGTHSSWFLLSKADMICDYSLPLATLAVLIPTVPYMVVKDIV